MKPLRLYLENFLCFDNSFLDLTQFSAALIVAKVANNDLISNGAGKSSIFRAIEYVLFNQADVNLEKLVRDDTPSCTVTMDVEINKQEYRISRSRTRKGSSDLTLYQRTVETGEDDEVFGTSKPISDKKFWKDISGRRAADTEKELFKLVKLNFKAFRSTIHFIQHDFSGLATATPENRKKILKEALNLAVYSRLEKIAKEESALISKQIEKERIILDSIGSPQNEIVQLKDKLAIASDNWSSKNLKLDLLNASLEILNEELVTLNNKLSSLCGKNQEARAKEKELIQSKVRIESSIKEYTTKKNNVNKAACEIVTCLKDLKQDQDSLSKLDFAHIENILDQISVKKEFIAHHNVIIHSNVVKLEDLKIPMPSNASCKHCRQSMSDDHKKNCIEQINKEMEDCQSLILSSKKDLIKSNTEIASLQKEMDSLKSSKQQLDDVNAQFALKQQELQDKKTMYNEYIALLGKFTAELADKVLEIEDVRKAIESSSEEEEANTKVIIDSKKNEIALLNKEISILNKEISHFNNEIAVINHSISLKEKELEKKDKLIISLNDLNEKFDMYPLVLQAFSSSGIPNLIIQNVLNDLQIEANNLLSQIKPGLQLSFVIEKTKGDGTQDDTLDINYKFNGRERDYEILSGAMKLAVTFSLKLGLSFLLQKMIGTDIKFLLLDEIDQSLDKASVDAFADIVKFFQNDFKILIITHNDRLKDKFSHAILVDQDIDMVSNASVVSSW
jgi:DNA repair exonuclease SbcCD ATPase subunit